MPGAATAVVKRRRIEDADLEAVAALLSGGFRLRPTRYWLRGLARLRDLPVPDGFPRYGYLLESDGRPVGALLMIFSTVEQGGIETVRCNLSSWYAEPAFRGHAALLLSYALKNKAVTYFNLSAAPHTVGTVKAQGFRPYGTGRHLVLPALSRDGDGSVGVRSVGEPGADTAGLSRFERRLLADHARWGCICLTVDAADGPHPFVFASQRVWHRLVPAMALVWCRDIEEFGRFAGAIGGYLLRRGRPFVLLDALPTRLPLRAVPIDRDRSRYVRGPHPPRPGDSAYTEGVFFGA